MNYLYNALWIEYRFPPYGPRLVDSGSVRIYEFRFCWVFDQSGLWNSPDMKHWTTHCWSGSGLWIQGLMTSIFRYYGMLAQYFFIHFVVVLLWTLKDAMELDQLISYLINKENSDGVVLLGHSTGCQVSTCYFISLYRILA